ncbi:MAG: hypothetical protein CMK32_03220 [Porticoccaceae bacterium]|nr:hypothetical protein [Porticoccaceae bacterium]
MFEKFWSPEVDLMVGDISLRVGHFDWPEWIETVLNPGRPVFSLSLTPRPYRSEGYLGDKSGEKRYRDVGDLLFYPDGITFHGRSSGGSQRILICSFDKARLTRLSPIAEDWKNLQIDKAIFIDDDRLLGTLRRIAQEVLNPGFAHETLIESLVQTASVDLLRYLEQPERGQRKTSGGLAPWQMRRIRERVESRTDSPPTIGELARLCAISPRHVMRGYKQATGATLHAYVEQVRLARAKQLLLDTDLPMKSIASSLGFSHASSFSAAFQRAMAMTPSAFRLLHRR